MAYRHMLFVEGSDDQHALLHLLKQHGVTACMFSDKTPSLEDAIAIKALGGYETLRATFPTEVEQSSELLTAGVIVDADLDPQARWQSLRDMLKRRCGVSALPESLPESLPQEGWIGSTSLVGATSLDRTVKLGALLLPDSRSPGALEEFAFRMVPDGDSLWPYAEQCLKGLPDRRFKDKDEGKARIHTWLAWQKTPRLSIGGAIEAGVLRADIPEVQALVDWVRRLFDL